MIIFLFCFNRQRVYSDSHSQQLGNVGQNNNVMVVYGCINIFCFFIEINTLDIHYRARKTFSMTWRCNHQTNVLLRIRYICSFIYCLESNMVEQQLIATSYSHGRNVYYSSSESYDISSVTEQRYLYP